MGLERLYRLAGLGLFAIGSLAGPAIAGVDVPGAKASLLELALAPGGSDDPPGDRLVAAILIYPGTDRVDLELGAEAIDPAPRRSGPVPGGGPADAAPEGLPTPRAVRAGGRADRGPDGRFRLKATARRPGTSAAVVQVPFIVPRSAIEPLPRGQVLRYTLRGSIDGSDAFSTATQTIDPSTIGRSPRSPAPGRAPIGPPVEVLAVVPDAPAPSAPSKALPAPRAPRRADVERQGAGAYLDDAESDLMPPAMAPPDRTFKVLPKRPVLFATNRSLRGGEGTPSQRFGDELDARIRYGSCLVNIPVAKHVQGQIEVPGWLSGADPDQFFAIDTTALLGLQGFRDIIAGRGRETRNDVLVYVHGFSTTFDFAVMRLAQVVHDIEFDGAPVVFSWPSHGSTLRYDDDEANAQRSVGSLTATLRMILDIQDNRGEAGRGKIHLIAHSLGNRVTLRALAEIHDGLAARRKPFGQIILAAPDVSVAEFTRHIPAAQARSDRVSLYFCPDDQALLASQVRHPYEPRAGRGVVPIGALDNIDARKANTSFLGHGYWAEVKQLLIDMQMLVNLGWGPERRQLTLQPMIARPNYPYWSFR